MIVCQLCMSVGSISTEASTCRHDMWCSRKKLMTRRVFIKEQILKHHGSSVNALCHSHSLHLYPLFSARTPSLCSLHAPQCKIWAQSIYKSGVEIMRVGPLSTAGLQPCSVPVTSFFERAGRLMSVATVPLPLRLIYTCMLILEPKKTNVCVWFPLLLWSVIEFVFKLGSNEQVFIF